MTTPKPLKPKKPRKAKSKKISVNVRQQWETILKTVTKEEVPVELLQHLTVNLIDGTKVNVDIKKLLDSGRSPRDIEHHINDRLNELDDMIIDVDFFIDIQAVSSTVSPMTEQLLKHI
jgi:hypothetical protein